MRLPQASASVFGLLALVPAVVAKPYPVHIEELAQLHNASQIEKRDCTGAGGTVCGWYGQLCCYNGDSCGVNVNNEAQCQPAQGQASGEWVPYTSTWVETGAVTRTSVFSSFVGATALATPTATCGGSQSPCGTLCCDSGYYCLQEGQCKLLGGGSSGGVIGTLTPSAPLRPTSSTLIIVTATGSPTTTVPFETPIATGANGTLVEQDGGGGGGLSGGAIAGIVIGVILGVLLLLLICLFCCARALFDTIMAIFGLGKKRKHTHEETYIEEHHHSSGGAAGGGRRWYGQGPARPNRPKKSGGMGNLLGMGAALGGLALALGLKRKHDRKYDDKSTTISGSSAYYSDYTSSSSASSSDRRTRHTRHSSRR